jgi:hypothetical protein
VSAPGGLSPEQTPQFVLLTVSSVEERGGVHGVRHPSERLSLMHNHLPHPHPQLQHDDVVTWKVNDVMRRLTEGRQAKGGCPLSATMFVTAANEEGWSMGERRPAGRSHAPAPLPAMLVTYCACE